MDSPLLDTERQTYRDAWAIPAYAQHSPGERCVPLFLDMTQTTMRSSVLDAGCGAGKGALALQAAGFARVTLCDLTREALTTEAQALPFVEVTLWDAHLVRTVGFHDWVYCADVLEHIPTALTMLVVARLLEVARRGVFLSVSLQPDVMGYWVGKPLHQTVQPFVWWRDHLNAIGSVVEGRDLMNSAAFLVKP